MIPYITKRVTDLTHEGCLEECLFICTKYFTHLPNFNPVLQLFSILQKCSRSSKKEPQRQHEDRRKCLVIRQWKEFKVNQAYQYRYWKKLSLLIAQKEYIKIFQLKKMHMKSPSIENESRQILIRVGTQACRIMRKINTWINYLGWESEFATIFKLKLVLLWNLHFSKNTSYWVS